MKLSTRLLASFALLLLFMTLGCKKDKDDAPFSKNIQRIVSQAAIDSLRNKGMIINEGATPPNLEGVFLATPYVLVSTYAEDTYMTDDQFSDLKVKFSGQDNTNLGITIDMKNAGATGSGVGAFISGSGNKFSIFAEIDLVDGSATAKQIRIFSGEIEDGGIKNFYSSLYLKEKNDPSHMLIPVGQGRILKDKDGLAERTDAFRMAAEKPSVESEHSDSSF